MDITVKLPLPPGTFDAYLLDCDGTIADSMPLHYEAWNLALGEWGGHFPEDLFFAWAGIPTRLTIEMLNERFNLAMPVDEVLERKETLYYELLPKLRPVASVLAHLENPDGRPKFAVVSGSPRLSVIKTLEVLKLLDRFPVIIGAEDYARGKPHPDPYLLAAKLVKVAPERCLVFEDADLGVESARAAGMACVRVPVQPLPKIKG